MLVQEEVRVKGNNANLGTSLVSYKRIMTNFVKEHFWRKFNYVLMCISYIQSLVKLYGTR